MAKSFAGYTEIQPSNQDFRMKKFFAFWLGVCLSVGASSQTIFSFSGLNWDDTLEQTDAKLTASGLPLTSNIDKLACRIKKSCSLQFAGAVRGSVTLEDGKLKDVEIFSEEGPNVYAERAQRLRAKYGSPQPTRPNASVLELLTEKWRANNGESIELQSSGYIIYRRAPLRGSAPDVKF